MENESAEVATEVPQKKHNRKKTGKIAQAYELHKKGLSVKEISEKMKISEKLIRAYVWRMKNPQKYKTLLNRYFTKRKQKQTNEEIKNVLKKQVQKPEGKEVEEK